MHFLALLLLAQGTLMGDLKEANIPMRGTAYYGPTNISNQHLEDVTIYGPATIANSTISGDATIKGALTSSNSNFNYVTVEGKAQLNGVTANKIVVIPSSKPQTALMKAANNEQPTITLDQGSKIQAIAFKGESGVVIMSDTTSQAPHIENGQISK